MNFMIGGRAVGKTTKLIKLTEANPTSVLIVPSAVRIDQIRHHSRIPKERILTLDQAKQETGLPQRAAFIDDLDMILPRLLGVAYNVEVVTATGLVVPL